MQGDHQSTGDSYFRIVVEDGADTAILVFSHTNYPSGKFAMSGILETLAVTKIFLNCPDNAWYQQGIPGLSKSIPETVTALKKVLAELKVGRVICTGMSMGGYGAILFGLLLDCQVICAFTGEMKIGHEASRSWKMNRSRVFDARFTDLHHLIEKNKTTRLALIYGAYDLVDLSLLWSEHASIADRQLSELYLFSGMHQVTVRLNVRAIIENAVDNSDCLIDGESKRYLLSKNLSLSDLWTLREIFEYKQRRMPDAILDLFKSRSFSTNKPYFCLALGNAFMDKKKLASAGEAYLQGLRFDRLAQPLYHALGLTFLAQENYVSARDCFRRSISFDNTAISSLIRCAQCHEHLRQESLALECYGRVLKIVPDHQDALEKIAKLRILKLSVNEDLVQK